MTTRSLLSWLPGLLLAWLAAGSLSGCHSSASDAYQQQYQAALDHQNAYAVIDDDTIQHYLKRKKITTYTRTTDGVYIVPVTTGSGTTTVAVGKQVRVKYTGTVLSVNGTYLSAGTGPQPGKVFDTSTTNGTTCGCTTFTAGTLIPGFNEALTYMHQGDRALMLLPSLQAYGPSGIVSGGSYAIYPDSALLFDVEILEILP